jgi:AcrR family transcriptional regulator
MNRKITKNEILNQAYKLFREDGFDAVSVDTICLASGITKPTFYKYIESKESILTTFYDDVCKDIMLNFAGVYQAETYYEQFHLFYQMIIERSEELGPSVTAKMMSLNLTSDSHSFETRSELTDIVLLLIEKGQKSGEFLSTESAADLYNACNFVFLGLEYKWSVKRGAVDWSKEFWRISDGILQAKNREN